MKKVEKLEWGRDVDQSSRVDAEAYTVHSVRDLSGGADEGLHHPVREGEKDWVFFTLPPVWLPISLRETKRAEKLQSWQLTS